MVLWDVHIAGLPIGLFGDFNYCKKQEIRRVPTFIFPSKKEQCSLESLVE